MFSTSQTKINNLSICNVCSGVSLGNLFAGTPKFDLLAFIVEKLEIDGESNRTEE